MSSRHVQDMSSRRLQDMSSRLQQDVFSATIFRHPRRLKDALENVKSIHGWVILFIIIIIIIIITIIILMKLQASSFRLHLQYILPLFLMFLLLTLNK